MRTVTPVTAGRPALADDSVAGAFQWGKRFSPLTVSGNLVVSLRQFCNDYEQLQRQFHVGVAMHVAICLKYNVGLV